MALPSTPGLGPQASRELHLAPSQTCFAGCGAANPARAASCTRVRPEGLRRRPSPRTGPGPPPPGTRPGMEPRSLGLRASGCLRVSLCVRASPSAGASLSRWAQC